MEQLTFPHVRFEFNGELGKCGLLKMFTSGSDRAEAL